MGQVLNTAGKLVSSLTGGADLTPRERKAIIKQLEKFKTRGGAVRASKIAAKKEEVKKTWIEKFGEWTTGVSHLVDLIIKVAGAGEKVMNIIAAVAKLMGMDTGGLIYDTRFDGQYKAAGVNGEALAYGEGVGGKTKIYIPEQKVPFGYDNWKDQAFSEGFQKTADEILHPKSSVKVPEVKQKQAFNVPEYKQPSIKNFKKRKGKKLGGKAGENFREDYRRYLESLENSHIDPDDKVKIREIKDEIENEIDNAEDDANKAEEDGFPSWDEFKDMHAEGKDEEYVGKYKIFKKTNPQAKAMKYHTWLAGVWRFLAGRKLENEKYDFGMGGRKKGRKGSKKQVGGTMITQEYFDPKELDIPKNIDGRPIPWSSRPILNKGGKTIPDPRISAAEIKKWEVLHNKLVPVLKEGNLSNVNQSIGGAWLGEDGKVHTVPNVGKHGLKGAYIEGNIPIVGSSRGGAKKGKMPKQLMAWHSFLKDHPWDGKGSRKEYLKDMGALYRKK